MMEPQLPSHLGVSSQYRTRNEVIAMRTELAFTPLPSAPSSSLLEAPGLTLTRYIPKIERTTPIAPMSIGARTAFIWTSGEVI